MSPQEVLFAAERGTVIVDVRPENDYDEVCVREQQTNCVFDTLMYFARIWWPCHKACAYFSWNGHLTTVNDDRAVLLM